MVVQACNPSTLGGRGRRISEFEARLVYRLSSKSARAIQRNPVSKKPNPTPLPPKKDKTNKQFTGLIGKKGRDENLDLS